MNNIVFQKRLEEALNCFGIPRSMEERAEVFSKLFDLSRYTSISILSGTIIPDEKKINIIADELEVSASWLIGKSKQKR